MTRLLAFLMLAQALWAALDPATRQHARIEALEGKLLAPCCYAEPVSRHRSEVALQMRKEIARMVAEGRSDREITDSYVERYGRRILIEPEGAGWWWSHAVVWIVLILGTAFTIWTVRRKLAPADSR